MRSILSISFLLSLSLLAACDGGGGGRDAASDESDAEIDAGDGDGDGDTGDGDAGDGDGDADAGDGDGDGDGDCTSGTVEARVRYLKALGDEAEGCPFEIQTRTCNDERWQKWSGSYEHAACSIPGHPSCGDTGHGEIEYRLRFQAPMPAYPEACRPETQYRVCDDGDLEAWQSAQGNEVLFEYATCEVQYPGCGELAHTESNQRTRYEAAVVPFGETCEAETQQQLCVLGTLLSWTGTYEHASCTVAEPVDCGDVPHGLSTIRFRYEAALADSIADCRDQIQYSLCTNGSFGPFSGTYAEESCRVRVGGRCDSQYECASQRCLPGGICGCPGKWQGDACDVCPSGADEICYACRNQWTGDACDVCPEAWSAAQDCNACSGHWTGTRCDECPAPFDPEQGCTGCEPGWSGPSCSEQAQCVRYVTAQPYGGVHRNGLSWRGGFAQLDDAVASAAQAVADNPSIGTCEVWVQRGTYGPYYGHRAFSLHPSVAVYGGFAGTETERDQRDFEASVTVFQGNNGTFVLSPHGGLLDGFVLRDGYAFSTAATQRGGALRHESGELTVRNSSFLSNRAGGNGGAVYIGSGNATFERCTFDRNVVSAYQTGGAIHQAMGDLTIIDSTFTNNSSSGGGAIYLGDSASTLTVSNSRFIDNAAAGGSGGAIYGYRVAIDQSTFSGNTCSASGGSEGGAIYASELEVDRSIFAGNEALDGWAGGPSARGGAIRCNDAELIGSTFYGNKSLFVGPSGTGEEPTDSGAVWCSATVTAINSIFWQNTAATGPAIHSGDLNVSYSLVEGGAPGAGNIDADPLFNPSEDKTDISLQASSPCIDAANGDYASEHDVRGQQRHDQAGVPNTGIGTPDYADMGAWERSP